jgi:hypothetical protein
MVPERAAQVVQVQAGEFHGRTLVYGRAILLDHELIIEGLASFKRKTEGEKLGKGGRRT